MEGEPTFSSPLDPKLGHIMHSYALYIIETYLGTSLSWFFLTYIQIRGRIFSKEEKMMWDGSHLKKPTSISHSPKLGRLVSHHKNLTMRQGSLGQACTKPKLMVHTNTLKSQAKNLLYVLENFMKTPKNDLGDMITMLTQQDTEGIQLHNHDAPTKAHVWQP